MKHPAGNAPPRRLAKPRRKVRLNLQRRPEPKSGGEREIEQKSNFWKWFVAVALFHLLLLILVIWSYKVSSIPAPPVQFISLLPDGDVVKGNPGAQEAHKLGTTTTASVAHHAASPPPAAVAPPPKPVLPKPLAPPPLPRPLTPVPAVAKTPPKPLKPVPPKPKPPKVKLDLSQLEDAPPAPDKPIKPKHVKKPVAKAHSDETPSDDRDTTSESTGLSKEKIAEKLGEKMDASGVKNATKVGTSGSTNAHPSSFASFYDSIRDQVMSQWESPNLSDETAVNPIVQIHVEKDGRVPTESVHLIQSSGNPTYDDSAVAAAKSLGYLHQPLPDGCPPDIPITFKLTR
jgi:TonB family protein